VVEQITPEQSLQRWYIDLDWYAQRNRSMVEVARRALCPVCASKLFGSGHLVELKEILDAIQECCSSRPEFIYEKQPVMESIFRIFLANGNRPLTIQELGQKLSMARKNSFYLNSAEFLFRLLKDDELYGFRCSSN